MADSYVAPGPGGFVVVIGGQQIGTYPDQTSAEQAYNTATGQSNAPSAAQTYNTPNGPKTLQQMRDALLPAPPAGAGYNGAMDDASIIAAYNSTASGTGAGAGAATPAASSAQGLLDAIASGDRERLDEEIRKFNVTSGQIDRKQYGDLASTLLSTASQLRGPKDYMQFSQYTSGGKDLMSLMNGNTPRPDFSAPTGPIEPFTIQDLMAKLGLTAPPAAGGTATPGATGTYNTVNGPRTVDQMFAELRSAGWGGQQTDVAGIVAAYQHTTNSPVTPATGATTPQAGTQLQPQAAQVAPQAQTAAAPSPAVTPQAVTAASPNVVTPLSALRSAMGGDTGVTPRMQPTPAAVPFARPGPGGMTTPPAYGDPTPGVNAPPAPGQPVNPATTDPTKTPVRLPYQWNPAVWDSLSQFQKDLLQSTAESQGWDWGEYMRQMNASRPVGQAPSASMTQFASPTSAFSGAR